MNPTAKQIFITRVDLVPATTIETNNTAIHYLLTTDKIMFSVGIFHYHNL
jgi:hypothetical protein